MDQSYVICMDTGADIPWHTAQRNQLTVAHLRYTMNDSSYIYDLGRETDLSSLYFSMRNGTRVVTEPVAVEELMELWNPILASGRDILYLGISAALSNSFHNARRAREHLIHLYPMRRIVLVDTRSCSVAQGMLSYEAAAMRGENKPLDDTAAWVVENRAYLHGLLLVDSLKGVREAGLLRAGALRELLNRQTLLRLGLAGDVELCGSFKTEESAIAAMADYAAQEGFVLKEQTVSITHTDAAQRAAALKEALQTQAGCVDVSILPMGPIVGAHVGAGAVGVAFFGRSR